MGPSSGNGGKAMGMDSGQLHAVGGGIAAGGSLIKGIGGYEAGKVNAKIAQYNKRVALGDNVGQQQQVRDAARAAMGEQIAAQGASGVVLGTGSAMDALHQSAINAQLDAMELQRKASVTAENYDLQSWQAKAQGKAALVGGIFDAATAIASGGANYAAAGAAG